ncbi:TlpA disulfide reductase family protein [Gynurincola endophyticus]|jgi:thiol-disulfide isomerase/thioredoxin|uniref:TlpA disulfide reductase family protein n=1 Tax=Gynurincola endophyticus TaxID=2479004 RepID=UPI000F8DD9F9|nr:TlpA disulfide reductase family protein [Gynurincola endophyticus]
MKQLSLSLAILLLSLGLHAQSFEKISMDDLLAKAKTAGHPVVLNVWATWCAPCVEELPYLNEGVKAFKKEKVELWLLSMDFPKNLDEKLKKFIKEKGYTARYFWLTDDNADEFCPKLDQRWEGTIPVTLFYNPLNNYRKFLNRAITKAQVPLEIKEMIQ